MQASLLLEPTLLLKALVHVLRRFLDRPIFDPEDPLRLRPRRNQRVLGFVGLGGGAGLALGDSLEVRGVGAKPLGKVLGREGAGWREVASVNVR